MSGHHAHVHSREELIAGTAAPVPSTWKTGSLALAVIGLIIWLAGVFVAPDRAWKAWQFNWMFFTIIASAGVTFAAVQRIVTARWSRGVIRFLEGYVAFLPIAFVMLAITLLFGRTHIWDWAVHTPEVKEKAQWLAPGALILRDLVMFGAITAVSVWFVWTSVRLDVGIVPEGSMAKWMAGWRNRMRASWREERREIHATHSIQGKIAVLLAMLFGYGWVMLAWDLSMSADVHWQSTMYGWQVFMGGWLAMLMSFSMLIRWWRARLPIIDLVTDGHYHDIGKLCFAFTAFWGYITFSQYLVMWYGNMAEETHRLRQLLIMPWKPFTMILVWGTFAIPFFGLLSRSWKSKTPIMAIFVTTSILGIWIQRYLEIYPPNYPKVDSAPFGIWEIGTMLAYLGLFGWSYFNFMDAVPRARIMLMTSPYRDEVQVPVDPKTMEPLPAHE